MIVVQTYDDKTNTNRYNWLKKVAVLSVITTGFNMTLFINTLVELIKEASKKQIPVSVPGSMWTKRNPENALLGLPEAKTTNRKSKEATAKNNKLDQNVLKAAMFKIADTMRSPTAATPVSVPAAPLPGAPTVPPMSQPPSAGGASGPAGNTGQQSQHQLGDTWRQMASDKLQQMQSGQQGGSQGLSQGQ